jgi:hypothetical protein
MFIIYQSEIIYLTNRKSGMHHLLSLMQTRAMMGRALNILNHWTSPMLLSKI